MASCVIECGHSRYGRFEFQVSATPATDYPPLNNMEDYLIAMTALEAEVEDLQNKREALAALHRSIFAGVVAIGANSSQASTRPASDAPTSPGRPPRSDTAGAGSAAAGGHPAGSAIPHVTPGGTGGRPPRVPVLSTSQQPAAPPAAPSQGLINPTVTALATLYDGRVRPAQEAAVHAAASTAAVRVVLQQYLKKEETERSNVSLAPPTLRPPVQNYRASEFFVGEAVKLLGALFAGSPAVTLEACKETSAVLELFRSNLKHKNGHTRKLLTALAHTGDQMLQRDLHSLIRDRVLYCLAHHRAISVAEGVREEMALLADLATAPSGPTGTPLGTAGPSLPMLSGSAPSTPLEVWQERVSLVFELLLKAAECAPNHPAICENVVLPCLQIILALLGDPSRGEAGRTGTPSGSGGSFTFSGHPAGGLAARPPLGQSPGPRASFQARGGLPRPPVPEGSGEQAGPLSPGQATKATAEAINELEEEVGPAVRLRDFQMHRAGYEHYLRHRNRTALYISNTKLSRFYRMGVRYGRLWRERARAAAAARRAGAQGAPAGLAVPILERRALVASLLLNRASPEVRTATVTLLERLCQGSEHHRFNMLNLLISLLPLAADAGTASAQYFDLLCGMVAKSSLAAQYLSRREALPIITRQLAAHVGLLLMADVQCLLQPSDPDLFGLSLCARPPTLRGSEALPDYAVHRMAELLGTVLDAPGAVACFTRQGLLETALLASTCLFCIEFIRTKLTGSADEVIGGALRQHWLSSSEAGRSQLVRAGLNLARRIWEASASSPTACIVYGRLSSAVLEQVADAVHVEPRPVAYQLSLEKASTQEEFIPRYMPHNPYHSIEIGSTMRDIKKFICKELDLGGLSDDDDYCLELLVAGQIISLGLPIQQVFEGVWLPSLRGGGTAGAGDPVVISGNRGECDLIGPPMVITYRLPGLDGEATEPVVRETGGGSCGEAGTRGGVCGCGCAGRCGGGAAAACTAAGEEGQLLRSPGVYYGTAPAGPGGTCQGMPQSTAAGGMSTGAAEGGQTEPWQLLSRRSPLGDWWSPRRDPLRLTWGFPLRIVSKTCWGSWRASPLMKLWEQVSTLPRRRTWR
eukprot:jgi/Botrbrau1/7409/Bobra.0112s0009.1